MAAQEADFSYNTRSPKTLEFRMHSMPIYEYRCDACGAELEKLQKISDPPARECPECGKEALVKRVSASSFRLKGSGWYESDFKTGTRKHGVSDGSSDGGNGGNGEKSGAAETSSDTIKADSKAADKPAGASTPTA